jgi:hypothetical protein
MYFPNISRRSREEARLCRRLTLLPVPESRDRGDDADDDEAGPPAAERRPPPPPSLPLLLSSPSSSSLVVAAAVAAVGWSPSLFISPPAVLATAGNVSQMVGSRRWGWSWLWKMPESELLERLSTARMPESWSSWSSSSSSCSSLQQQKNRV